MTAGELEVRVCPNCDEKLVRKDGEFPSAFKLRRYCDSACFNEWTRFKRPIEHGTPAGTKQHRKRGEEPCTACLKAEADYRRSRPVSAAQMTRKNAQANARNRALARLIAAHRAEFFELCNVEYEKAGVPR